jgi:hypothetical protein
VRCLLALPRPMRAFMTAHCERLSVFLLNTIADVRDADRPKQSHSGFRNDRR